MKERFQVPWGTRISHRSKLQLCPLAGPLQFVSFVKRVHLLRSKARVHDEVVRPTNVRSLHIFSPLPNPHWHAPPLCFKTIKCYYYMTCDPWFVWKRTRDYNKSLHDSVPVLKAEDADTSTHCLQTKGQAKNYFRVVGARFRQYISELEKRWDTYVQPLIGEYSSQMHRETETFHFSVTLPRQLAIYSNDWATIQSCKRLAERRHTTT